MGGRIRVPGPWLEWASYQEPRQEKEHCCFSAILLTQNGRTFAFPILALPPSVTTHRLLALLMQILFGRYGSKCPSDFCLFHSDTKNLLFNDNTECLSKLYNKTTSDKYLGQEYVIAIEHLKQCSSSREYGLNILGTNLGESQGLEAQVHTETQTLKTLKCRAREIAQGVRD